MREYDQQYVLRIWKDGKGDHAWRMSLRELNSQETIYFADKAKLLQHLMPFVKSEDEWVKTK